MTAAVLLAVYKKIAPGRVVTFTPIPFQNWCFFTFTWVKTLTHLEYFLTQVSELQLECRMSYTITTSACGFNTYDLHLCNFIWFSTFTLTRQSTPKLYKLLSQSAIESYWSIEHGGFCYYFLCTWGLFFVESINYT